MVDNFYTLFNNMNYKPKSFGFEEHHLYDQVTTVSSVVQRLNDNLYSSRLNCTFLDVIISLLCPLHQRDNSFTKLFSIVCQKNSTLGSISENASRWIRLSFWSSFNMSVGDLGLNPQECSLDH